MRPEKTRPNEFFFRDMWQWKDENARGVDHKEVDYRTVDPVPRGYLKDMESWEEVDQLKFKPDFVRLMNNRMRQGFFRYGVSVQGKQNYVKAAKGRIKRYEDDGNLEHLIDAANILRMEFDFPWQENAHFTPVDDGEHDELDVKD